MDSPHMAGTVGEPVGHTLPHFVQARAPNPAKVWRSPSLRAKQPCSSPPDGMCGGLGSMAAAMMRTARS